MKIAGAVTFFFAVLPHELSHGFVVTNNNNNNNNQQHHRSLKLHVATTQKQQDELAEAKKQLLGLVKVDPVVVKNDPVLCDPLTMEPLDITIASSKTLFGGTTTTTNNKKDVRFTITSPSNTYEGSSQRFYNLLEPIKVSSSNESNNNNNDGEEEKEENKNRKTLASALLRTATPFLPPPLRSALANAAGGGTTDYIPMRDLFTSPAVSFAYERGWRQGFQQAGFPGPDKELQLAMDYFLDDKTSIMINNKKKQQQPTTLVDMSCATGLFTRRFAKTNRFDRVLGCDYSESMLEEARRRIEADSDLSSSSSNSKQTTRLELVRLDVGKIPMKPKSVDYLHAGAAMHCWPDLPKAMSEIHRVLKPNGGKYFATTFLSSYFATLQATENQMGVTTGAGGPSRQAFQYFDSIDTLRNLVVQGGFAPDKVFIEVVGRACVIIRAEK